MNCNTAMNSIDQPCVKSFDCIEEENGNVSIMNTASVDIDDFDTQMSPLIYVDSDTDGVNDDDDVSDNDGDKHTDLNSQPSIFENSQSSSSPEIFCNQEHAARTRLQTLPSKTKTLKPNEKKHIVASKTSKQLNKNSTSVNIGASKRFKYKKLSIKVSSNECKSLNLRGPKAAAKVKAKPINDEEVINGSQDSSENSNSQSLFHSNRRCSGRRISSTSDVQIISQKVPLLNTITISSSDENSQPTKAKIGNQHENDDETQINIDHSASSDSPSNVDGKKDDVNAKASLEQKTTTKIIDLFGAPDECDDIDLSTTVASDIFEITKNSVFDNILCSANDKITPAKSNSTTNTNDELGKCCLSGLRIIVPKLSDSRIEQIQQELLSQSQSQSQTIEIVQPKETNIIDLTNTQNFSEIQEISSEENAFVPEHERTPEKQKLELTPTTRSCLKRNPANDTDDSTGKKFRSPSRSGWLSTKNPQRIETPLSRRRFDKWLSRTEENNLNDEDLKKITKPRNLFNEFRTKSSQRLRRKCTSTNTVATENLNIFSDDD